MGYFSSFDIQLQIDEFIFSWDEGEEFEQISFEDIEKENLKNSEN